MQSMQLPKAYLSQNRSEVLWVALITAYVLSFVVIVLRFLTRRITNASLWWDDWFILAAFTFSSGYMSLNLLWLILGLGKHIEVIPPADIIHVIKGVFASEFLYTSVITCVKYSILCFYWRIFSISSIKLPIYILGTIITGWSLACIFTAAFQCIPTAKLWDIFGRLDGHCINVIKFFVGNAIPNIITDVALLILPLPHIWRLQVPGTQKLFVLLAFIFGGATIVISIVRVIYVSQFQFTGDFSYNAVDFVLWSGLELSCAIICACLPSLRPIVRVMLRQPIVVYIRGSKPSSIELKPKSWHSGPLGRSRIAPSDLDNWEPLRDASSNGVGGKAWVPGSSTQAILGLQTVCITADPPSTKGRDRDRDKERGSSDGDSERNIELEEQGRAGIFVRTEMTWQNE